LSSFSCSFFVLSLHLNDASKPSLLFTCIRSVDHFASVREKQREGGELRHAETERAWTKRTGEKKGRMESMAVFVVTIGENRDKSKGETDWEAFRDSRNNRGRGGA
jgi:hypothetical protein